MGRFSQYPVATSPTDYTDATNFLIEAPDGSIKLANMEGLSTFFCSTYCASVTIASADILNLDSVPVEIVAAQGLGTLIQPISATVKLVFNSAAYTGAATLRIGTNTAQDSFTCTALDASVSTIRTFTSPTVTTAGYSGSAENTALSIDTASSVATGDSDIEVFIIYRIITV